MALTRESHRQCERRLRLHSDLSPPSSRRVRVIVTILGSIMLALLAVGLLSRGDRGSALSSCRPIDALGGPDVEATAVWTN